MTLYHNNTNGTTRDVVNEFYFYVPVNMYPTIPLPAQAAQGKTRGFDISFIKSLYLGIDWVIDQIPLLSRFYDKHYPVTDLKSFTDLT